MTNQQLIEAAKKGEQSAFKKLLDKYWDSVYAFQLKRTKNTYQAEEVCIQSFARAFDKLDTYQEQFNFKTWLITISKNIQIDINRKKSIETSDLDQKNANQIVDIEPTAEDRLITEQNLTKLLGHIKSLKPHYQEVIHLRYFKELSYKAIAEELNQPINNVKVKLLRAKKLLAERLNP
ncbi:RNA polymerase sigma-70 factor, ECF subfamily [Psychroflexus salarius]|uniref:RNA polymerase sigma-70 factor, ECF subfamily n=1 Tax=Psychroflexus salarius TaxID=1155689 RepID=A0A1M4XX22_9FLAO|nr:sigma-70 family RNA polymerase sigma factor [Psychroflexus salarius]SHE98107.1 RNA polymerase sigma-70 factor, ECF subfamily [Psychroflexus salarius]